MKKIILPFLLLLMCAASAVTASAQRATLSKEDRDKYLEEVRQIKHDFIVKELNLSRDQQNQFFPLYDKMEDEINQIAEETRALEAKVSNDTSASDTEIESAARAVFEQKSKEGQVEISYFSKFKEVLTNRQLLSLKNVDRKFTQQLMRSQRRTKK